jgi:hypothetical protein
MMHLVSLVWLVLFLISGVFFFRRFLGTTTTAGMAVVLFCLDDAHIFPAFWLANRNALIAAVPAILAFLMHDKWRKNQHRCSGYLAPLFFAIGLMGGEFALGIMGFFIAYALFLDPEAPKRSFTLDVGPSNYSIVSGGTEIHRCGVSWLLEKVTD